jgi:hypothetical protein
MRQLCLLLCLFVQQALAQQGGSIIDWLTSLQGIQARLQRNGGDGRIRIQAPEFA